MEPRHSDLNLHLSAIWQGIRSPQQLLPSFPHSPTRRLTTTLLSPNFASPSIMTHLLINHLLKDLFVPDADLGDEDPNILSLSSGIKSADFLILWGS